MAELRQFFGIRRKIVSRSDGTARSSCGGPGQECPTASSLASEIEKFTQKAFALFALVSVPVIIVIAPVTTPLITTPIVTAPVIIATVLPFRRAGLLQWDGLDQGGRGNRGGRAQ